MTNKEAIEVLKNNYPCSSYTRLREAVDIAIKGLEAYSSTDVRYFIGQAKYEELMGVAAKKNELEERLKKARLDNEHLRLQISSTQYTEKMHIMPEDEYNKLISKFIDEAISLSKENAYLRSQISMMDEKGNESRVLENKLYNEKLRKEESRLKKENKEDETEDVRRMRLKTFKLDSIKKLMEYDILLDEDINKIFHEAISGTMRFKLTKEEINSMGQGKLY